MDVFASSHTCLPALREFAGGVVANNGAAGMPNIAATRFGLLTRISTRPFAGPEKVSGAARAGAFVESLSVEYDHEAWTRRFLRSWPAGSAAHESYFRRIADGPRFLG